MQRDYIIRMIQQFIQALAAIIMARKAGKYEEAIEHIQTASQKYLETDISTFLTSEPKQILDRFKTEANQIDPEKCIICGDLLNEMALISEEKKYVEAAVRLKILSLYLYVNAILEEKQFQVPQYIDKANALIEELMMQPIPDDVIEKVRSYKKFFTAER